MHEAMVDGRRIAYTRVGLGPALVLLHGGLGDSRSWRPQLEACAAEHTVLAWDAPGCGRSSDPPATWRMPEYADCVAGWLGAIGVDRAHVLGLSWGSSLALELYRRHPGLPSSLVLASAYAGWGGSLPPGEVAEADLRDVLPTIRVPTLLLHGSEDVRSPLRVAHELHRAIPGSDLVVLPGVGHESNVEAPDAFTREVLQFLRRASGRTAE
jgi:pimeloyl-ACP methyl ester carboxylesterase